MTNKTTEELPRLRSGTIWFAVIAAEFAIIFMINALTVIVFAKYPQLRKRSTYLIINLCVADLLVGAVTGPLELYISNADIKPGCGFSWKDFSAVIGNYMFIVASFLNLSLISLERLHATLYPFQHVLIEKLFYFKVIFSGWLLVVALSAVATVVFLYDDVASYYLVTSLMVLTLLILMVCSVTIIIKVKRNPPPHPSSTIVASERKLTITLLLVTIVSILTILPIVPYRGLRHFQSGSELPFTSNFHVLEVLTFLYYMNSMVNPLLYIIRMQEFRKAAKKLIGFARTKSLRANKCRVVTDTANTDNENYKNIFTTRSEIQEGSTRNMDKLHVPFADLNNKSTEIV